MNFSEFQKPLAVLLLGASILLSSCKSSSPATVAIPVEAGVSRALAAHRKENISQLRYQLQLHIPRQKKEAIQASETIKFHLKQKQEPLQLDFKEQADHVLSVTINRKRIAPVFEKEHLILPANYLRKGENQVEIEFIAGNLSLNRNEDFLYTLLVPDRARTVFPCFDQPDLKATFALSLTLPQDWQALANGPLQDSVLTGDTKTYHYVASDTISTYLFSFVAGKFSKVTRTAGGREMNFYHRETDTAKLNHSLDQIFRIHGDALKYMQEYTRIPYPFQKFDFVAIPDFQYGGMEHVGAIDYKASSLFLDEGSTRDQEISRSSLISHETAHMWFGDLVTMQWFNDVWMKEVFANFMADKITKVALADSNFDLKFLLDHFPAAYAVDRTAGANPIRQQLDNLQDAGTMYGNIIYHKAPIVMRQLERLMGEEAFKQGLQVYLQQYAFGNATWPDLIEILDARTPIDLQAWNQVWVNESGRPQFDYQLEYKDKEITSLTITQKGEDGSDRLWPQLFEVALVYKDHVEEITVNMHEKQVLVKEAAGRPRPLFILFNSSGQGYGQFPVDLNNLAAVSGLKDPVMRASAYINMYESMLNGRDITPTVMRTFTLEEAAKETEELNQKLLLGQLQDVFWQYTLPQERKELGAKLESSLWAAMLQQKAPNARKLFFKAYQQLATTKEAQDKLFQVWKKEQAPAGVTLTEDDYTSLALALAVRNFPGPVLEEQLLRIKNPDRQNRLRFLMPALSPDPATRNTFFASLKQRENREKEAWVTTALAYLHHPLRAETSQQYLQESLELLEEIQLTGDIFFPANWLQSTFGSYQSSEAAESIRTFLQQNSDLNPKLRAKVLQAADGVFRAEKAREAGR
ncbi:M1 family aminopeptidase [Pontibacter sp. SGAir0037]|uniref:M1 family metallopeptidase n=1 Tax=Pontibacter sp. SGAir0037 TaxID=2571030 RepID=UPI0010CD633E|nr:M1 family aminopeptidase [Pontibacter sp. SGAir0037]QCR21513.1 aminopeptidase [Pontibacter sp. SGAir0037]